jgi:hypothetical protein
MALRGVLHRDNNRSLGACCLEQREVAVVRPLLLWIAVPLMLLGAGMLIAGIGSAALWIAVVALGIALVAVGRVKPGTAGRR